jgi:hypothetical protein
MSGAHHGTPARRTRNDRPNQFTCPTTSVTQPCGSSHIISMNPPDYPSAWLRPRVPASVSPGKIIVAPSRHAVSQLLGYVRHGSDLPTYAARDRMAETGGAFRQRRGSQILDCGLREAKAIYEQRAREAS